jgi:hypothetical protein
VSQVEAPALHCTRERKASTMELKRDAFVLMSNIYLKRRAATRADRKALFRNEVLTRIEEIRVWVSLESRIYETSFDPQRDVNSFALACFLH